ncbi:MAG: hypothetical protein ACOYXT_06890 [Bacteroidota bacterium]
MKKFLLSLSALLVILLSGCQDTGMESLQLGLTLPGRFPSGSSYPVVINTLPDMTALINLIEPQIATASNHNDVYLYRIEEHIFFNSERFVRDRANAMAESFNVNWDVAAFVDGYSPALPPATFIKPSQVANASMLYNAAQLSIIDSYAETLYDATDFESILGAGNYVRSRIRNGLFTSEQRYLMMAFVISAEVLAFDFFNEEYSGVKNVIIETGVTGETLNCRVNWRSVWAGAVVGGVATGIHGVVIGATGGTVALPGFGTATGAVGGGVFGFAKGFIGGAASSIAAELLTSCFSQTVRHDTTPPEYMCDTFEEIKQNSNCLEWADKKLAWKING